MVHKFKENHESLSMKILKILLGDNCVLRHSSQNSTYIIAT